jgi:hypothetical protein
MSALALLSEDDVRDPRDVSPPPPPVERPRRLEWADEIATRLVAFLDLEPNWDSFGAVPPRWEAVEAAYELLMLISDPTTPTPQVVPTTTGGVQLEWHQSGIDLEVEVNSAFRFSVLYENSSTGELREEELVADLTPLRAWVRRLSE